MKIAAYEYDNKRSVMVANAVMQGCRKLGINCQVQSTSKYRYPDSDVAIFYGYGERLRKIMADYKTQGKIAVAVDIGYFGRKKGKDGYHRISVNDRHPDKYFQKTKHPDDRLRKFNINLKPYRKNGKHILLGGMSAKAAGVYGYKANEFEKKTLVELRKNSGRKIVYRPKPSWNKAIPLAGASFSKNDLDYDLRDCHAVVVNHSNLAIDALIGGVPVFTRVGCVATPMGLQDLTKIESPYYPEDRYQWLCDVCYCQYNLEEISEGMLIKYLEKEGFL